MKYYVINLKYAKDRLKNIDKYFSNNNIKYDIFNAIDGKELILYDKFFSKELLNKYNLNKLQFYRGSIGCSLSHVSLWNKIYNENNNLCTILEDDVKFDNMFELKINFFISQLPDDWDVLYLGRKYLYGSVVNKYFIKGDKTDKKGYNVSSYGYVIKKESCKKLYDIVYPLSNLEQDLTLRTNLDKYNAYFLINPLVLHENFSSCIAFNNNNNKRY